MPQIQRVRDVANVGAQRIRERRHFGLLRGACTCCQIMSAAASTGSAAAGAGNAELLSMTHNDATMAVKPVHAIAPRTRLGSPLKACANTASIAADTELQIRESVEKYALLGTSRVSRTAQTNEATVTREMSAPTVTRATLALRPECKNNPKISSISKGHTK